jgi:hypothetical protein
MLVVSFLYGVDVFLASYSETHGAGSDVRLHESAGQTESQNNDPHFHAEDKIWREWLSTPSGIMVTICTTMFNIHKFYVLPTQCIYVFCVDLRTNSDYFTVEH